MRAILKCAILKFTYAATAVAAVALGADRAAAQAPFPVPLQAWGPAVAVKDVDPAIRAAAEVLGIVRTRALVIGQVNLPELSARAPSVDLEATGAAAPVEVSRYSYGSRSTFQASRLDFEGPQTPRTIKVVKGNRAWNESWSDDKAKLSTSPSSNAAYRSQLMWLAPHAFVHAAAFASAKKCLDGKACTTAGQDGAGRRHADDRVEMSGTPTRPPWEPTSGPSDRGHGYHAGRRHQEAYRQLCRLSHW